MKDIAALEAKLRTEGRTDDANTLARLLKILYMAADENVKFSRYDIVTDTWDNANPVFHLGDAFNRGDDDAEQILGGDVDKLYDVYLKYGYEAGLAWAAKKRKIAVTAEFANPAYRAAQALV